MLPATPGSNRCEEVEEADEEKSKLRAFEQQAELAKKTAEDLEEVKTLNEKELAAKDAEIESLRRAGEEANDEKAALSRKFTSLIARASAQEASLDTSKDFVKAVAEGLPALNQKEDFQQARKFAREYGFERIRAQLGDFVDATGRLTTETKPFNVFARKASGKLALTPEEELAQGRLGSFAERFMVCYNMPDRNANWANDDPEWVGRAGMSKRHCFLTVKDLDWQWFNVITFGLDDPQKGYEMLADLYAAAKEFTQKSFEIDGSFREPAFYLHCYGHNSVNSLHLHMVDLEFAGPTHRALAYKNLPVEDALAVLRREYLPDEEVRDSTLDIASLGLISDPSVATALQARLKDSRESAEVGAAVATAKLLAQHEELTKLRSMLELTDRERALHTKQIEDLQAQVTFCS